MLGRIILKKTRLNSLPAPGACSRLTPAPGAWQTFPVVRLILLVALTVAPVPLVASGSTTGADADPEPQQQKPRLGGYKILPVPIFITEPAIGKGLGVALALFHPSRGGSGAHARPTTPAAIGQIDKDRQKAPPVVTGVFGAYTSSDTWAAGIGHMNHWREDSIRYKGALAKARVNSTFYFNRLPVKYSLEGDLLFQDARFRLADSNLFLGASFSYLDATNAFKDRNVDLPDEILGDGITNTGLAAVASYDSRDNTMNPNRGQLVELNLWRYDDLLGGNYEYWSATLTALSFHPFLQRFTLGFRLDVTSVDGKPPFFGYPWVKLRGIPAMRYQDESAGAVEAEARYQFAPKWEVLAFVGAGFTGGDTELFDNPDDIYSFGAGGRYKVIEEQNVWLGIDVARGPEETNWYIQASHAW